MTKRILVIGATGHQGNAAIESLQKAGFAVRAFTRDSNSPKAIALKQCGVQVAQGDLDNFASLQQAMEGCYGVFSVIQFLGVGVEKETEQGIRVADAALSTGIRHFIYSSVGGAERNTGVPHFESKWKIEQHIREIGLASTILRPTLFMDNFQATFKFVMLSLMRSLLKDRQVQMIAVDDIGKWVALAFLHPDKYMGQSIEIASDALSYKQIQAVYRKVTGKSEPSICIPSFVVFALMKDIGLMFKWFRDYGYQADIAYCRSTIEDSITFEQWLLQRVTR
jgi:uncharacterized protein YbjT (DUF2867 family)